MTRTSARRTAVLAVAASMLVMIAGLPAQAATAPAKWGKTFCGALNEWSESIQASSAEVQQTDPNTITPTQGKAILVRFLGDATDSTTDFRVALRKAGNPAVKNGRAIQSTLLSGIAGVEALLQSLGTQAEQLPTTDTTTFRAAAAPLGTQLEGLAVPFEDALDEVSSLETKQQLSKVMRKVKACRAIL